MQYWCDVFLGGLTVEGQTEQHHEVGPVAWHRVETRLHSDDILDRAANTPERISQHTGPYTEAVFRPVQSNDRLVYAISSDTCLDIAQYCVQCNVQERLCLLYTSPSPRDGLLSRMPSSA